MVGIGLELGGTWTRGIALHSDGVIGERIRELTPDEPRMIGALLYSFWEHLGRSEIVGLAAAPYLADGRIERWPARPNCVGTDILGHFNNRSISPLILDDVSAAVVAEHLWITAKEALPSSSVMISVGTGVGAGAVLLDRLWTGSAGKAMDLGHIPVALARDTPCSCGAIGCLQTIASGNYLSARANELGLAPDELADALMAGDSGAKELFLSIAGPLGQAVLLIERLLDPDRIILGGGVAESGKLTEFVADAARGYGSSLPISQGKWGTWAGAIGAAVEAIRQTGQSVRSLREHAIAPTFRIALVQGPNLNLLGEREVEHYGGMTLKEIETLLAKLAQDLNCHLYCLQANSEVQLIEWLQKQRERLDGVILNPAALTARGYGLRDTLTAMGVPFIEVHLSNIYAREAWHHESCFADVAIGRVSGLKATGYALALRGLVDYLLQAGDKS